MPEALGKNTGSYISKIATKLSFSTLVKYNFQSQFVISCFKAMKTNRPERFSLGVPVLTNRTCIPGAAPTHAMDLGTHCMPHRPPPRCAAGCLLLCLIDATVAVIVADLAALADARAVAFAIRRVQVAAICHARLMAMTLMLALGTDFLFML